MPGKRIKQYREAKGINQQQMAEMLHMTQSTYSHNEQKEENLNIGLLRHLSIVLLLNDLLVYNLSWR